jgi:hypothetical protein
MEKGQEVEFHITGMTARYKGMVENPEGHNGRPEIKVTRMRVRNFRGEDEWAETFWPILKDGDYIL